jgi:hypothetical protein
MVTKQELINLLKQYDFINNSIGSFSLKYGVSSKTISKYLRENNIPYNRKETSIERDRDNSGKFIFSKYKKDDDRIKYQSDERRKCRSFKDLNNLYKNL